MCLCVSAYLSFHAARKCDEMRNLKLAAAEMDAMILTHRESNCNFHGYLAI